MIEREKEYYVTEIAKTEADSYSRLATGFTFAGLSLFALPALPSLALFFAVNGLINSFGLLANEIDEDYLRQRLNSISQDYPMTNSETREYYVKKKSAHANNGKLTMMIGAGTLVLGSILALVGTPVLAPIGIGILGISIANSISSVSSSYKENEAQKMIDAHDKAIVTTDTETPNKVLIPNEAESKSLVLKSPLKTSMAI